MTLVHVVNERGEPGYHVDYGAPARRSARRRTRHLRCAAPDRPPQFIIDMDAAEAVEALLKWVYPAHVYHIPRIEMPGARLPIRAVTDDAQSYVAQLWAMLGNGRADTGVTHGRGA